MPNTFEMPDLDTRCSVCNYAISAKHSAVVNGKTVCIKCHRYKHIVHAFRFVEFIAAKDCMLVQFTPRGSVCSLNCKCDPCTARKVAKFISKMTS